MMILNFFLTCLTIDLTFCSLCFGLSFEVKRTAGLHQIYLMSSTPMSNILI